MGEPKNSGMEELLSSISNIGVQYHDLEKRSKEIVQNLKKSRADLIQESYDNAFNVDNIV